MTDNEVSELIVGWSFVLGGLFIALLCTTAGLFAYAVAFCALTLVGLCLLIETFWHYQAPLIPATLRTWKEFIWTR